MQMVTQTGSDRKPLNRIPHLSNRAGLGLGTEESSSLAVGENQNRPLKLPALQAINFSGNQHRHSMRYCWPKLYRRNFCERLMNTMRSKKIDEEKIKRIVGNAVATESFEYLDVTDQEIEELERLARGNITMEEYLKSDCDDERNGS